MEFPLNKKQIFFQKKSLHCLSFFTILKILFHFQMEKKQKIESQTKNCLKVTKNFLIIIKDSIQHSISFLDMSNEQIMGLNLPTGIPFVYELDENFKPVVSMKFLGDEATVKAAIEAVAAQGKAK